MVFDIHRGTNVSHWLSQSEARGEKRRRFFTRGDAQLLHHAMERIDTVVGVMQHEHAALEPGLQQMIDEREEARRRRDFRRADALRDALKARGILLEDGPDGVRWKHTTD